MSFLSRSKSLADDGVQEEWIPLESNEQWKVILSQSYIKPVVIFKHSVRCGLSAQAKHSLLKSWANISHDITFYYLDLLKHREISDLIAQELSVTHQSPQLIIIKDGQAIFDTSHHGVKVTSINAALD